MTRASVLAASLIWVLLTPNAHAAPLLFSLTGSGAELSLIQSATFTIDSAAVPDYSSPTSFTFFDVSVHYNAGQQFDIVKYENVSFATLSPGYGGLYFLNGPFVNYAKPQGFQLFTGPTNAPTFKIGSFALFDPNGVSDYSLTIAPEAASAAPEPATWAMTIAGFGLIGGTMRSRRNAMRRFESLQRAASGDPRLGVESFASRQKGTEAGAVRPMW